MGSNSFLRRQLTYFLSILFLASFFLNIKDSYAIFEGVRDGIYYDQNNGRCKAGDIEFDPFGSNEDVNWEISNPVCATFIAIQGAAMMAAGYTTDALCVAANSIGVSLAAAEKARNPIPDSPFLNPTVVHKLAHRASLFTSRLAEYYTWQGTQAAACAGPQAALNPAGCAVASAQLGLAASDSIRCGAAYSSYLVAVAAGVAALGIIYASAKGAYDKARICGHDWNSWAKVDQDGVVIPNSNSGLFQGIVVSDGNGIARKGKNYQGSYQKCLEDLFVRNTNSCDLDDVDDVPAATIGLTNKYYREYIYGGKEFADSTCQNPSSWSNERKLARLGYLNQNQRYYMQGPGVAGNYACRRFLLAGSVDAASNAAYECCVRRSQNTICIENAALTDNDYSHAFCEFGQRCNVKGIWFEPFPSRKEVNYICIKTYSVCPYNHLLGGGTENKEFRNDTNGFPTSDMVNFCQFMKHCAKIPVVPYVRMSDLHGAFISGACRDLKGDAQNVFGYDADIMPISARGFSAPIVECFKETLQNLMMNKAGSTQCLDPDESPTNGICQGGYAYKEGADLPQDSFFKKIQENLRSIIKMVLTVSITFFGYGVLLGVQAIDKKKLVLYIVKIGLVMYFALGDAWQTQFVRGVLKSSDIVSDIMMKLDEDKPANKLDGCQFPRFDYSDTNEQTRYDNPRYPFGKEYLKIWDTLDCKLARAFGFGPQDSVPNLVKMILAGFFTGGLGIIFLVAIFIFAFFLLALIMRAIHIFLMATIAITLLIYVSPVTITLSLFERTKGIFTNWWKQLLGFILQPVILFAYLGIYISLFDATMIGDVTFRGDGRTAPKIIECDDTTDDTSIYCIFKIANLRTYSGLEIIGIGIPILTSLNKDKLESIMKAAFIMFIFSQFMDKISKLASTLVGGAELKSNSASAAHMTQAAAGALRGIQKRGTRLAKNAGIGAIKKAGSMAKRGAQIIGNRGRAVMPSGGIGGADHGGKSGSGGSNAGQSGDGSSRGGNSAQGSSSGGSSKGGADHSKSLWQNRQADQKRQKAEKELKKSVDSNDTSSKA